MPPDAADAVARYRETISQAWSHGDANVWPVKLNAAFHLFLKEFGEELLEDIGWLEANGRTLAEIARPFSNPARVYRIIDSTIYSMRRNRYPIAEQRAVVLKLLAMTRTLKHGSPFNEDGCNTIYDPATAEHVARSRLDGERPTAVAARIVHGFCAVMWAYTESIFFRAHDVTKEIHGPYPCDGGGGHFLVKEYLNLRPDDLWPDVPLLPCRTVKVYTQYSKDVRLRIDALNHLYHEGGPLVPNLERCAVEVDGERRDAGVLQSYLPTVQQTITTISRRVEAMTWNERVSRYADIFWFRKKPVGDQRGRDWRVPPHLRESIARGVENHRRRMPLSDEASARLAMLTI